MIIHLSVLAGSHLCLVHCQLIIALLPEIGPWFFFAFQFLLTIFFSNFSNQRLQLSSRQYIYIFSFVGCVMVPEIVVFLKTEEYSNSSKHHSLPRHQLKRKSISHFNKLLLCHCYFFLLLLPGKGSRVKHSFLIKLASMASDRPCILLEHCVFTRWQFTWDLIKIDLERDRSSTYART